MDDGFLIPTCPIGWIGAEGCMSRKRLSIPQLHVNGASGRRPSRCPIQWHVECSRRQWLYALSHNRQAASGNGPVAVPVLADNPDCFPS